MGKYGFVYIWFDRKHKRYYIGSHWGTETDGYICSSKWMRDAYRNRPLDFKRRVLVTNITTRNNTLLEEQRWLDMIKPEEKKIRYYNLSLSIKDPWYRDESRVLSTRQKIAIKTKKAMQRPEVIARYKEGLKTRNCRSHEIEVREKRRQSMIGKNVGKDNSKAREASRIACLGKPLSEEHKAKIKETTIFRDLNSRKIKCNYCEFIGNPGHIGRYHNARCKLK